MDIREFIIEPPREAGKEVEFFLQEALMPNSSCCKAHIHNAVEMIYVNEGSYRAKVDGAEEDLEKGDLILFCSNTIHSIFTKDKAVNSYYVIKAPPSFILNFSKFETGIDYVMRFALNREGQKNIWRKNELENSPIYKSIASLIEENEKNYYAAEVAVKLKIMELLMNILREDTRENAEESSQITTLIYKAILYVRSHYSEDIDERALAAKMGISYSYFVRMFKKVTGMTFKKYLNRTRINQAERLLSKNKSVSETAIECGFNSVSYFISVYREITGTTPYKRRKIDKQGIND